MADDRIGAIGLDQGLGEHDIDRPGDAAQEDEEAAPEQGRAFGGGGKIVPEEQGGADEGDDKPEDGRGRQRVRAR